MASADRIALYPPVAIIQNLPRFFEHRGLVLAARERVGVGMRAGAGADDAPPTPPALPDSDTIVSNMTQFFYERVDARRLVPRGARDHVIVIVLNSDGKYAQNGPALRMLLSTLGNERVVEEGRLDELFIIAEENFFQKKNLTDIIREFTASSARALDEDGRKSYFSAYPYHIFSLVVPDHESVPPHRVMSAEEVAALLRDQRKLLRDLATIYANDPPVIWCGGREGQVVEITRMSETAGQAIYYRRIVRAPLQ